MADPSRYPNAVDDLDIDQDRESPPRTPRWVKLFGLVVLLLILAFLIMKLVGVGGDHGPGRHSSSDRTSQQAVTSGAISGRMGTRFTTEIRGSGGANVPGGENVPFVVLTLSEEVHASADWDEATHQFSPHAPIDHLTLEVVRMVQA